MAPKDYGDVGMGARRGHNNAPKASGGGKSHKINEIVNQTPDYGGCRKTGGDKPVGYKGVRGGWDKSGGGK